MPTEQEIGRLVIDFVFLAPVLTIMWFAMAGHMRRLITVSSDLHAGKHQVLELRFEAELGGLKATQSVLQNELSNIKEGVDRLERMTEQLLIQSRQK